MQKTTTTKRHTQKKHESHPQICSADPQGCPGLPTGLTRLLAANVAGPWNVCAARFSDLISPFPLPLTRHSTPLSKTAHPYVQCLFQFQSDLSLNSVLHNTEMATCTYLH